MSLNKNKKILKIRKKLDILDNKMLDIIKIRTNLVHQVLQNKTSKKQIVDKKRINVILKSFFKKIQLQLVDFKLEFGYDFKKNILLGDEISPDNCRLWDLNQENDTIVSLDKDRFRNDLGGLIEAYSEIHRRINDFLEPS